MGAGNILSRGIVTIALIALPSIVLIPAKGWAQEIEEIVVSARKRDESLQDVPISIQAFSDIALRNRNIDNIYDVAQFTPNFQMARNLGRRLDRPIIRGMFSGGVRERNASFFVDGVYISGSVAQTNVQNLERVEVLRGPQAALFGRATFAGAINYITRRPTDEFEGEVNLRAGSNDNYLAGAWASGPLIKEKLRFFAAISHEEFGGDWRNGLKDSIEFDANGNAIRCPDPNFAAECASIPAGSTIPTGTGVNTTNDPNNSLDFFNGPRRWALNIQNDENGNTLCPPGYQQFSQFGVTAADPGCPSQRGDTSDIGGEETNSGALKLSWTPTESLELNAKAEFSTTSDGHYVSPYLDTGFTDSSGNALVPGGPTGDPIPGMNCFPAQYDPANQIYVPSPGWSCGEMNIENFVSQFNLPHFAGVSTCPPGTLCVEVERNPDGTLIRDPATNLPIPILDSDGNFLPTRTSAPSPVIGAETETQRYLLEAMYNWRDWQFAARFTDSTADEEYGRDLERNPGLGPVATGLFEAHTFDFTDDNSFELRAVSPQDSPIRGLLGVYYYDSEELGIQRRFNGFGESSLDFEFTRNRLIENQAIFGSIEIDLSKTWTFSFEGRYAEDQIINRADAELTDSCQQQLAADPAATAGWTCEANETFTSFTPRVTLRWSPKDNLNFYGLVAKGNKPGQFNESWLDESVDLEVIQIGLGNDCAPDPNDDPNIAFWKQESCGDAIVDEEIAWTYELGAKTFLLDNRLMLNSALFYIDWTNQAVGISQCIPRADQNNNPATCESNLGLINAGKTRIYGLEIEASWQVTENLNLGFNYGLTDTEFVEFFSPELAALTCNQWELIADPFARTDCSAEADASGNETPYAPKQSVNLSADYRHSLTSETNWFARTFFNYTDKVWATPANLSYTPDAYIWDGFVGIEGERWTLTAFVQNILDEDAPTIAFNFPLFDFSKTPIFPSGPLAGAPMYSSGGATVTPDAWVLTPRRGRNYGVSLQWRFGG